MIYRAYIREQMENCFSSKTLSNILIHSKPQSTELLLIWQSCINTRNIEDISQWDFFVRRAYVDCLWVEERDWEIKFTISNEVVLCKNASIPIQKISNHVIGRDKASKPKINSKIESCSDWERQLFSFGLYIQPVIDEFLLSPSCYFHFNYWKLLYWNVLKKCHQFPRRHSYLQGSWKRPSMFSPLAYFRKI